MQTMDIKLTDIHPYEHNPRRNDEAVMYVKNSIQEFGMKVPLVIDKNNVIVAGHTRYQALIELGWESAPCIIADDLTDEQVKAFRLADNRVGEIATWDLKKLEDELKGIQEIDMEQFKFKGFGEESDLKSKGKDFFENKDKIGDSHEGGNEEYNEFVDKFKPKRTTDDCYTPNNIYQAVADFVAAKYGRDKEKFVRPFYPDGDYQKYEYSDDCTVVDNPPFSILAEIIKFYLDHDIKFYLFAPALTLFSPYDGICFVCVGADIVYENGANIKTSFITNLDEARLKSEPALFEAVDAANNENLAEQRKELPQYDYPDAVVTSAMVQQM